MGLTWFTDRTQLSELVVFHSGHNQGFVSLLALVPDRGLGVIFLANSLEFEEGQHELALEILRLMVETKYGVRPPGLPVPVAVGPGKAGLSSYVGRYVLEGAKIDVGVGRSGLTLKYRNFTFRPDPVDEGKFRFNAGLLGLGETLLTFVPPESGLDRAMIVSLGGSYHIICPEYPVPDEGPALWSVIEGSYRARARHPSAYSDSNDFGQVDFTASDGMLLTSDGKALLPADESLIRIVGGVFDGEVMERDPSTGTIVWQNFEYSPES